MDEVFISATNDVVVGDGDGVDAAPAGLQDMNALQRPDVPNLTTRKERISESDKKKGGGGGGVYLWKGRTPHANLHSSGKSELLDS